MRLVIVFVTYSGFRSLKLIRPLNCSIFIYCDSKQMCREEFRRNSLTSLQLRSFIDSLITTLHGKEESVFQPALSNSTVWYVLVVLECF